nr:hypothetical protein [Pseudomonas syringae]
MTCQRLLATTPKNQKPKKDVPMNLRVPDEFKRRVDQFALDHRVSVKKVTMQALEEFMNRAGAAQ